MERRNETEGWGAASRELFCVYESTESLSTTSVKPHCTPGIRQQACFTLSSPLLPSPSLSSPLCVNTSSLQCSETFSWLPLSVNPSSMECSAPCSCLLLSV